MKISILIPVYGVEKYIERCARSVLEQDYRDVEYIFVDDASPDRSIEILRRVIAEYPDRDTKIIAHHSNMGLAAARNTAVDAATGDYILHVDSDDRLAPGAVAKLAAEASATGADIIVFDYIIELSETRRRLFREPYSYASTRAYIEALLWRRARLNLWSKLVRRSLYDDVRAVPGIDYGEDFVVLPRLAYYADKIVKLDEALYCYNCTNTASISAAVSPAKAEQVVRAAEVLDDFFSSKPDYVSIVPGMKLHNKISLLQIGDRATWRYARGLYREVDARRVSLFFRERMVLWLARWNAYWAMGVYRRAADVKGWLRRAK